MLHDAEQRKGVTHMHKNITVIPATLDRHTKIPTGTKRLRRVAGYARVSTDKDEQFTSYEAQVDYYTKYIRRNPQWAFVNVYTDEGISGVMTKNRDGFNQMIEDALAGQIDLIVTKSVSRFARNTVDSLTTVRKLKEKGVEVYFEKENIYTLDSKGELLITIMSSLAQEESRSISENVTWGRRKQFADGKVCLPYSRFLGYEKGPDGLPQIVPEQAEQVRYIYDLFMLGMSPWSIAKRLTAEGIPSPGGKEVWQVSTVRSILTNEKYKGNALLQKAFTVDFLQKKSKVNEGEVPQYYVRDSHPAIIAPDLFERVQAEMRRRQAMGNKYSGKSVLSGRIVCGGCGEYFGVKVWNSNDKYRRVVWRCNNKYRNGKCNTPHVDEKEVHEKFLMAYNQMIAQRERLLEDCAAMKELLTDISVIDVELASLQSEQEVVIEMTRKIVAENASVAMQQSDYLEKYTALVDRYESLAEQITDLERKRLDRQSRAQEIDIYMKTLVSQDGELQAFDPRVWLDVIEKVTVYHDGRMVFQFKDGRIAEI